MDMRELEGDVQRLVGYKCIVTSGVTGKGPHIDFNCGARLLRIWIPRSGVQPQRIAEVAKGFMADLKQPAFKEIDLQAS